MNKKVLIHPSSFLLPPCLEIRITPFRQDGGFDHVRSSTPFVASKLTVSVPLVPLD